MGVISSAVHNVTADYFAKYWNMEDFIKIGNNPKEFADNNVFQR